MSRVRVTPKKSIPSKTVKKKSCAKIFFQVLPTHNGPSPYGFIDEFLLEQIRLYSPKASIRSWTISEKNVLKYDVKKIFMLMIFTINFFSFFLPDIAIELDVRIEAITFST